MSQSADARVFILGAGCSAKYGYPLGNTLVSQLRNFRSKIPEGCDLIRKSVEQTIDLMNGLPELETLDQLAQHLEDKLADWLRAHGVGAGNAYNEMERRTDEQIGNAKLATSAMFITAESSEQAKRLDGYQRFLDDVFGGEPLDEAVRASDSHILTFNYDRLLEIAFLERFKNFDRRLLYGRRGLNSGFDDGSKRGYEETKPADGRFCFLKLHGSADWWVKKRTNAAPESRLHWPTPPKSQVDSANLVEIEKFLEGDEKNQIPFRWQPLIAFPHEKQRSVARETDFAWDPYIRSVEAHAASVLARATEVTVIGYSFAPIDSGHFVNNLLAKARHGAKIVVRNPDIATVDARLGAYPTMRKRVKFEATPF